MRSFAPFALFVLAVFITGLGVGILSAHFQTVPYTQFWDAVNTIKILLGDDGYGRPGQTGPYVGELLRFAELEPSRAPAARVELRSVGEEDRSAFLVYGGLNQFLEQCPEAGCLAVVTDGGGKISRTYPYRPADIWAANVGEEYPYEAITYDFETSAQPIGVSMYPDGDLLVAFQRTASAVVFPFGAGVARIAPDGTARWFRRDYSHHWPTIAGDGMAYVPGVTVSDRPVEVVFPDTTVAVPCASGRPYHDTIRLISGDGELLRELQVLKAFQNSPFRGMLVGTSDGCDPLHLNYIDVVTEPNASQIPGAAPGDLVVSFRNINAFALIDGTSAEVKWIHRGGFHRQHSVQHLGGTTFLLFDNFGGDSVGGPSRLLAVDVSTGEERTVFAGSGQEDARDYFSAVAGAVDVSPDRTRALVTFSESGRAFEVDVETGEIVRMFWSVHDVRALQPDVGPGRERAAVFKMYGVAYLDTGASQR